MPSTSLSNRALASARDTGGAAGTGAAFCSHGNSMSRSGVSRFLRCGCMTTHAAHRACSHEVMKRASRPAW